MMVAARLAQTFPQYLQRSLAGALELVQIPLLFLLLPPTALFLAALAVAQQVFEQPAGKQLDQTLRKARRADSPAARALPALPQRLALLAARPIPSGVALAVALEATAETLRWMVALVGLAVKAVVVVAVAG
jgi:hypothetical protein